MEDGFRAGGKCGGVVSFEVGMIDGHKQLCIFPWLVAIQRTLFALRSDECPMRHEKQ